MRRKYTKRVQFYTHTAVVDTYGGSTVTDTLLTESWCNIRTPNKNDVERGIGIDDPVNQMVITTPYRVDTTYSVIQYAKYNSIKYVIKSIFNKDLLNKEIELIVTKE